MLASVIALSVAMGWVFFSIKENMILLCYTLSTNKHGQLLTGRADLSVHTLHTVLQRIPNYW